MAKKEVTCILLQGQSKLKKLEVKKYARSKHSSWHIGLNNNFQSKTSAGFFYIQKSKNLDLTDYVKTLETSSNGKANNFFGNFFLFDLKGSFIKRSA